MYSKMVYIPPQKKNPFNISAAFYAKFYVKRLSKFYLNECII